MLKGCGEVAERTQRGRGEARGGMPERDAADAVAASCNPMCWRLQPYAACRSVTPLMQ